MLSIALKERGATEMNRPIVCAVFCLLAGCVSTAAEGQSIMAEDAARADTVQRLLIEVCLPYVVDGASEATVAKAAHLQRFSVFPSIGSNLSCVSYFYRSSLPGMPELSIANGHCSIQLRGRFSDLFPLAVAHAVSTRGEATYEPAPWSADWPGVVESADPPSKVLWCVRGATSARIVESTPSFAQKLHAFDVEVIPDKSARYYCPRG